uniref:RING-type domain-containing protein n=1 Tax=Pseudonaja textilis TaxID=8673 RepID=A0A670YB99_PSETE
MGYDMERFVGYVNEGLICCICRDVLQDPLQAPCEHAFCTSCIHGWLIHHNSCPEDRQFLDLSVLRPLYRYMRNDLNRLQLHCTNRGRGCEIVCSLESIDSHECDCEYTPIPCPNNGSGCGYVILGPEDAQHNCVAELRTELDQL